MKSKIASILNAWSFNTAARHAKVGDVVSLKGYRLIPGSKPVAIVTVSPIFIDTILDEAARNDFAGVLVWVKLEKATFLPEGAKVKVLEFRRTPARKLSVAHVEIIDGPLAGRGVWTLMNELNPE